MMQLSEELTARAKGACELCGSRSDLGSYEVGPSSAFSGDIALCEVCLPQVEGKMELEANHWRSLSGSMWSECAAVQAMAYRMLHRLRGQDWAQDLLDQLYLEEALKEWADLELGGEPEAREKCVDSNGTILNQGDSVTIVKDLDVKGAGFTAKRGTTVKNISLSDDPALIEGRVNGTKIVLKTCFLKKLT